MGPAPSARPRARLAPRRSRAVAVLVGLVTLGAVLVAGSNGAASAASSAGASPTAATDAVQAKARPLTSEQRLANRINHSRAANHRRAYQLVAALSAVAETQARRMAAQQRLHHNPNLTAEVDPWVAIGENVAKARSVKAAHRLLMRSPGHRANLLDRTFTQVGLGVVKDRNGAFWVCEVFRKP